jgi:hypothetical protein
VGTTTSAYATSGRGLIELNGSSTSLYALKVGDTVYGYLAASSSITELAANGASQPLVFTTNATERARIDSSGNLLVGTTSNPYSSRVVAAGGFTSTASQQFNISASNTAASFEWVLRGGTGMEFYVNNATVLATLSSSGVWTNASDARYKENIRPVAYGLAEVLQLQPRAYNLIGSDKQEIGFVAQEVQPFIPEVVESATNSVTGEDRLTLSYGQLSAVLVKAIQELKAEVDSLKSQLEGKS